MTGNAGADQAACEDQFGSDGAICTYGPLAQLADDGSLVARIVGPRATREFIPAGTIGLCEALAPENY